MDPEQFTDRYEGALRELIEEKKRGHKITVPKSRATWAMSWTSWKPLKLSIAGEKGGKAAPKGAPQLASCRDGNLREQMTLEATLLTEQKTRKIIELLEELRRDGPGIKDRKDVEAEQMSAKADPHEVMAVIEQVTQEVVLTVVESPDTKETP